MHLAISRLWQLCLWVGSNQNFPHFFIFHHGDPGCKTVVSTPKFNSIRVYYPSYFTTASEITNWSHMTIIWSVLALVCRHISISGHSRSSSKLKLSFWRADYSVGLPLFSWWNWIRVSRSQAYSLIYLWWVKTYTATLQRLGNPLLSQDQCTSFESHLNSVGANGTQKLGILIDCLNCGAAAAFLNWVVSKVCWHRNRSNLLFNVIFSSCTWIVAQVSTPLRWLGL